MIVTWIGHSCFKIEKNGYKVILDKPYKKNCHRIKLKQGSSVFCNNNGTIFVKGKLKDPLEKILNDRKNEWEYNDKVFVVYGHDNKAKMELIELLIGWGINPLYIDNLPTEGRTIIEQLEHYIPRTNYGIVLATPDDEGYDKENKIIKNRARQNVIFEWGMLYSKLGRKRVTAILKTDENFECPSDINGILYKSYKNSVKELSEYLRRELNKCGYKID